MPKGSSVSLGCFPRLAESAFTERLLSLGFCGHSRAADVLPILPFFIHSCRRERRSRALPFLPDPWNNFRKSEESSKTWLSPLPPPLNFLLESCNPEICGVRWLKKKPKQNQNKNPKPERNHSQDFGLLGAAGRPGLFPCHSPGCFHPFGKAQKVFVPAGRLERSWGLISLSLLSLTRCLAALAALCWGCWAHGEADSTQSQT